MSVKCTKRFQAIDLFATLISNYAVRCW